jgi:hypothetical protein
LQKWDLLEYYPVMYPAFFLALLAIALASCKKQEPPAATATAPAPAAENTNAVTDPNAPAAPAALAPYIPHPHIFVPTEPVIIQGGPDINVTLNALSQDLRDYTIGARSFPKSWEDFVTLDHLTAPPPPEGKSYALAQGKVVLVNKK